MGGTTDSRNGKFIAVANMKGGVGKTTAVVTLAEALAADDLDQSILVIDLDPQASASMCIAGDTALFNLIDNGRTIEAFLEARLIRFEKNILLPLVRTQISDVTHRGQQLNLSLLPCGPDLRVVERKLLYKLTARRLSLDEIDAQIWQLFETDFADLKRHFDYIIFDCAPGISPVTEAAIRMADLVVVPTIPDYMSVYGLNAFHGSIWSSTSQALPPPRSAPHILISRRQNTRQHAEIVQALEAGAASSKNAYRMLKTSIPQSAGLASALTMLNFPTFAQKFTPALIAETLQPLVREVKDLL